MICCTRMENSPVPHPPRNPEPSLPRRTVALRSAELHADSRRIERIAQFTDGSTPSVAMSWSDVRRVAAFRRDVLTRPVLCIAVTDPHNVVVLDETMEGWDTLLQQLASALASVQPFTAWRSTIDPLSHDSYWTVLFAA